MKSAPRQLAWKDILIGSRTPNWKEKLKLLFPNPDFEDMYGLSRLHKAVLGLEGFQLDSAVLETDINIPDSSGMTPLHWAAARADTSALEFLIAHGADCNCLTHHGVSALQQAARRSKDCVDILLAANADVGILDQSFYTALHYATEVDLTMNSKVISVEIIPSLVNGGADIHAQTIAGHTPLMRALIYKNQTFANYLIQIGAGIGLFDILGNNALCWATRFNNHSTIDILLCKGLDHITRIEQYCTFMHLVAEYTDVQTLQLLARGGLTRRDFNVKNQD